MHHADKYILHQYPFLFLSWFKDVSVKFSGECIILRTCKGNGSLTFIDKKLKIKKLKEHGKVMKYTIFTFTMKFDTTVKFWYKLT